MAIQETDISFHRGEDVLLTVTMVPTVDITGWTITFTMRAKLDVLPVLVQKTGGPDITIVNGPGGIFSVKINSSDTAGALPMEYLFDIQRTDIGNRSVLVEGKINLIEMVNPVPA